MAIDEKILTTNVALVIIAGLVLCGSSLVCILFSKNKVLLKKSYNVFLLILAITDFFTAVVILVTSSLILNGVIPSGHVSGLASELFCRAVWSGWVIFTFSDASMYICLILTYKRWCAVVKPLSYRASLNRRHLAGTSVVIWIMALLSTSPRLFEVSYDVSRPGNLCCKWKELSATKRNFMGLIQLVLNIAIPSGVMIGIYLHILFKTQIHKNRRVLPSDRALRTRQGRTRMVRIALLSMLSCWMPYQVLYLLSMFGVTDMNFTTYHWTAALVFVSSFTNPFIYGVTNHTYRRGYFEIALGCCPVKVHGFLSRHLSLSQTHHAAILVQSIHGRLRPLSAPQTARQSIILDLNP